jgi:sterol desaturase/sphingolipid hydroxylase (fatty acid hydroxylase superfamily)
VTTVRSAVPDHHRPLAFLALVDVWYFFVHRWCHTNRTAYRLLHAKHHEPTGSLNATTANYNNPVCAVLDAGVPIFLAYSLTAFVTGNVWHALAGIMLEVTLVVYGHTGQWCRMVAAEVC